MSSESHFDVLFTNPFPHFMIAAIQETVFSYTVSWLSELPLYKEICLREHGKANDA